MDTTIYTYGFHLKSEIFALLMSMVFIISAVAYVYRYRQAKSDTRSEVQSDKKFSLATSFISGAIVLMMWSGYLTDYLHYYPLYVQHRYQIIEGSLHRSIDEPNNDEAFQVGNVIFRNSPRRTTLVFQGHSSIFQSVKDGTEVRIYYTDFDHWDGEYAILQIDVLKSPDR